MGPGEVKKRQKGERKNVFLQFPNQKMGGGSSHLEADECWGAF
jgi:hypothetical protein